MNLIETNHQTNMTSDHSVLSNNSFKCFLNASSYAVASAQSMGDSNSDSNEKTKCK